MAIVEVNLLKQLFIPFFNTSFSNIGGASCFGRQCASIHPYPDGGENGSNGCAPPVPVGDHPTEPGHGSETFDTIVSVSKLRYFCPKVSYRYRISIEILYLKSIGIGIGIEISDIKVSVSVSVSPFNILGIKLCISTIFTP